MKVFNVYINDTDAFLVVCGTDEKAVREIIMEDEDSPLFERDLSNERIDVYEEESLSTTHTEPIVISWMMQEYVNF